MPTSPSALLTAIIESSDDAIISKNLDGTITSWNRSAERIFGFTAQEAVGKSILIIIPPNRKGEEEVILTKLRAGERIDHFETVRQRKDGTLLDISVTISPIRDDTGEIVGASKVARNVSARKRYDAVISRKSEKLKILNELASSIAGELDLERLVQAATDAGRELTAAAFGAFFYNVHNEQGEAYVLYTLSGAPRDAFEKFGMPRNTPVFAPTFNGEGVVRVADILQDPRYGKMSPHHGMPTGHLPVRSYLAVPVFSRSGEVIGGLFYGHPEPGRFEEESEEALVAIAGLAGTAIDNARLHTALQRELAQQKALQHALRESETLSRGILDSTADCIMLLDREGRIMRVNAAGLRSLTREGGGDLTGHDWRGLWPAALKDTVEGVISDALAGKTVRFQGATSTSNNIVRWHDVVVSPLSGTGEKIERITATLRDITDFRRAENDARAAAEEALRQSRIKDDFLATLSHELRTPLQSILGWIQILRMDSADPEELSEGLEVIERNTLAQSKIVEDLLDMNRILSGKVRLDVQPVHLSTVLEAAVETVRPAAHAKGVRIQSILDPAAKPVSGDPNRLQQVFWNLLINAIKFTPRDGTVRVVLERVNSHLEVTVSDTGMGISAEFLPYVFDRFRQADSSTTRRHGGLGLGLAIVKHLTDLHGGSVRVKSGGEGQGATFIVHLPVAAVNTETMEPRSHPEVAMDVQPLHELPQLNGARVMVVDDETDSRNLIARILLRAGAEVMLAESGANCLEELKRSVPDVIVSDIGMPMLDGYSLIRTIRRLPASEGGRVPAIALTAYTRPEDRIRAIREGFQLHLSKPANAMELLTFVQSLWGRQGEDPARSPR